MGAEHSTLSAAEAEEQTKRFDAEIDRHAAEAKEKILRERREKRDTAQGHLHKESPSVDAAERDPGKVNDETVTGDVAGPIRSASSSQSMPAVKIVLAQWQPRKQKEEKKKKSPSESLSEDELAGFGNKPTLQGNRNQAAKHSLKQPPKQPSKQPPTLDTRSDTIAIPHRASAANTVTSPTSANTASGISTTIPTKRPATETLANDARRPSFAALSSMPKIQKRTNVASPQSPDRADGNELKSSGRERPPRWYKETPFSNTRNKNDGDVDALLNSLRTFISKAKTLTDPQRERELQIVFEQVLVKLHKVVFQHVTPTLLKRHRMLDNEDGLPQIFDPHRHHGVKWPWYIRADAEELYNKWSRRMFETNILRGINFKVKSGRKDGGDSIDEEFKAKWVLPATYHGNGDLINGQWWPKQICALRDAAHGSIQAGISGAVGQGAFSCVLSGGNALDGKPFPNQDNGEEVLYCGTDSDNGTITTYTQHMLENLHNRKPVRFIRSHNANTRQTPNPYAPEMGFRYDGLYRVVSVERLDHDQSERRRHRFKLVRVPGQDPIRGGSGPEKRPTREEAEEWKKHQTLSGRG